MREYKILSDSSCDIEDKLAEAYGIRRIPFYVTFNQNDYLKENEEITNQEFYQKLQAGNVFPKTSLPSIQDYINVFTEEIKKGYDILCFTLTAKFSGSHQSALSAKDIVAEDYPDAKIEIVDSIQATGGQGIVVLEAAQMKEAGFTLEQAVSRINVIKETSRIMFTTDTLEYLQKGGRIGKVTALAGSVLQLKPMIQLKDKELIPYSNVRGRKKSLEKIVAMTEEYFSETKESPMDYRFGLVDGAPLEELEKVKTGLIKYLTGCGCPETEFTVFKIGVTIGTYTGPGAIGVTFIRKFDAL